MDLRLKILVPIAFALVVIAIAFGFFLHLDLTAVKTLVGAILIGIGFLAAVIWYAVDIFLYRPLLKLLNEYRPAMNDTNVVATDNDSPLHRLRQLLTEARDAQRNQRSDLDQARQAGRDTLAALHESEQRYALAVRGANDGLWEWDIKSNAMYMSPRWKGMLGFTDDDFPNSFTAWRARIHPDDLAAFEASLKRHLQGEAPHLESEHRVIHKDGSYRWVLSRAMALRHANGAPYRMLGLDTDTSQFKHVEDVLMHVAQGTANATGEEFFRQMVQHFALALNVRVVWVARCMDTPVTRMRTVACWDTEKFINKEYALEPTPCKKVIEEGVPNFIPQELNVLYPMGHPPGMVSYLGVPIFDSKQRILGHIVFKDDKKMDNSILMDSVYQIFTARAGAEMERMEGQRALMEVAQGGDELPAEERLRKIVGLLRE